MRITPGVDNTGRIKYLGMDIYRYFRWKRKTGYRDILDVDYAKALMYPLFNFKVKKIDRSTEFVEIESILYTSDYKLLDKTISGGLKVGSELGCYDSNYIVEEILFYYSETVWPSFDDKTANDSRIGVEIPYNISIDVIMSKIGDFVRAKPGIKIAGTTYGPFENEIQFTPYKKALNYPKHRVCYGDFLFSGENVIFESSDYKQIFMIFGNGIKEGEIFRFESEKFEIIDIKILRYGKFIKEEDSYGMATDKTVGNNMPFNLDICINVKKLTNP